MTNGKGDDFYTSRTKAADFAERWERTFTKEPFSYPKMKTCPECQREWGGYLQWCPYCAVNSVA